MTNTGRVEERASNATGAPHRMRWASEHGRQLSGWAIALVIAGCLSAWGLLSSDLGTVRLATTVLMFVALAEAWNLLGGYAGYPNFGMVMFFGVGAYTTAVTANEWDLNALATVPVAAAVAGLAGVVLGVPTLRLRGGYFAIGTFVLTTAVMSLTLILPITNGAIGIGIPPLEIAPDASVRLFFELFLATAALCVLLCWLLERTKWAAWLISIREDEDAAEVLGVPTSAAKAWALVVGAALAGITGALYATQLFYIEPTGTFDFQISLAIVVAAVVGGAGTWLGPLVGAVITQTLAQELLVRVDGTYSQISYGVLLVVVVLLLPRGLVGILRRSRGRRFGV